MTTQHKVSETIAVHKSDYAIPWIKLDAPRINISAETINSIVCINIMMLFIYTML